MMAQAAVMAAQGAGTIAGGISEKQVADAEGRDLSINAGEQLAAGQRGAAIAERQTAILKSRQTSAAGGSGAGASDVGVQAIEADTQRMGEYDAMSSLYRGESVARGLRYQATMTEFAGHNAMMAAFANPLGGSAGADASAFSNASTGTIAGGSSGDSGATGDSTLFSRYAGHVHPWTSTGGVVGDDSITGG
jgi:hypothetical protein